MGQSSSGSSGSSNVPSASMPSWSDSVNYNPTGVKYDYTASNNFTPPGGGYSSSSAKDWSTAFNTPLSTDYSKLYQNSYTPSAAPSGSGAGPRMAGDFAKIFSSSLTNLNKDRYNTDPNNPYGGRNNLAVSGGTSQTQGDLTFVYPQTFQPFTIPGHQSTFSKVTGALAMAAAPIPGVGPFIAAGLGAASSFG